MNYTRDSIEKMANESGFIREVYEKVVRLVDVLEFINSNNNLVDKLSLKGGTAINLLYFNLPRLSVDIDLDYIGSIDKKEMLSDREIINKIIISFMVNNNYILSKKSKRVVSLDSLVFNYNSCFGGRNVIKIEINYMNRCHVLECTKRRIVSPFMKNDFDILTIHKDELYASKLNALLDRSKVRDLFDIYYMIKTNQIMNLKRFKYLYVFYNMIGGRGKPLDFELEKIKNMHYYEFKRQLKPQLAKMDDFDAEATKDIVIKWIKDNIVEDENIKEFIDNFNNGIFTPEILFEDMPYNKAIIDHPMAKWRIMGINKNNNKNKKPLI
ncbi:MAG: nucleotidyl transferase AbiEii/AbiGii toxin family protein [Acholeplasmatales bacterium]|nr:nucleotidyl transferase AbiEii/AbiGii toxin family protein [Acholeplasmatales bacterium]